LELEKEIDRERKIDEAANAYFTLEAAFKRKRIQRIYNIKKEKKEVSNSYKTFKAFIKRKEVQRSYTNFRHQSFRDKLIMIYKNVGSLLQNIQGEYKNIYIGEIPIDIINKRKDLDKKLSEELDFAKDILEILETKFGEDITVHLYNIDKFKAEIIERELGQYGQARASFLQQEDIKMKAELNKQQVAQAQFAAQKTATNLVDNVIKKSLGKIK